MGVAEATFYRWKKRYGGLDTTETRRLEHLGTLTRLLPQRSLPPWFRGETCRYYAEEYIGNR